MAKGDGPAAALLAVVGPPGGVHHGTGGARAQRGPDRGASDIGAVRSRARFQGDPGGQRQGERNPVGGQRRVRPTAQHPARRDRGQ